MKKTNHRNLQNHLNYFLFVWVELNKNEFVKKFGNKHFSDLDNNELFDLFVLAAQNEKDKWI